MERKPLFFKHIAQTSPEPLMLEVDKAEGHYVYDVHGKPYFDLIAGISVSQLGHKHPAVTKALKKQLDQYWHVMVYGEFIQDPQIMYAEELTRHMPEPLESVYFVNSGSEAVEGALKLAKRYTGRHDLVYFDHAYHGSTHGALSVSGGESLKRNFRPLLPGVKQSPFNDINSIDCINTDTAAVIVETIQGEAGARPANTQFLEELRKRCDETGALLIFDEIQAGMGRTGSLFAFEHVGVQPDILLLGKALGGGLPIGAFISSQAIMSTLMTDPVLGHISTFGGHPLPCIAGYTTLQVLFQEQLIESVEAKAARFQEHLSSIKGARAIHGKGLMMALEIGDFDRVLDTIKRLFHHHQVISDWFVFNSTSIRIAPPLTITFQEIDHLSQLIADSLPKY
jgi:acetylornithine/succinyldiaminopimelate/putrescine aminotransferase